jgi:hypothetical protein
VRRTTLNGQKSYQDGRWSQHRSTHDYLTPARQTGGGIVLISFGAQALLDPTGAAGAVLRQKRVAKRTLPGGPSTTPRVVVMALQASKRQLRRIPGIPTCPSRRAVRDAREDFEPHRRRSGRALADEATRRHRGYAKHPLASCIDTNAPHSPVASRLAARHCRISPGCGEAAPRMGKRTVRDVLRFVSRKERDWLWTRCEGPES